MVESAGKSTHDSNNQVRLRRRRLTTSQLYGLHIRTIELLYIKTTNQKKVNPPGGTVHGTVTINNRNA